MKLSKSRYGQYWEKDSVIEFRADMASAINDKFVIYAKWGPDKARIDREGMRVRAIEHGTAVCWDEDSETATP